MPLETKVPDQFVKMFWDQELQPILDLLGKKEYIAVPQIQPVHDAAHLQIVERYGVPLHVTLVDDRDPMAALRKGCMPMAANTLDGQPVLSIYVPELAKMLYQEFNGDRGLLETSFVIGLMHELFHLANGLVPVQGLPMNIEHMFYSERVVWAHTCEDVIRIFVDHARRRLAPNEQAYWNAWKRSGRKQNSPAWKRFIEERYKAFKFL